MWCGILLPLSLHMYGSLFRGSPPALFQRAVTRGRVLIGCHMSSQRKWTQVTIKDSVLSTGKVLWKVFYKYCKRKQQQQQISKLPWDPWCLESWIVMNLGGCGNVKPCKSSAFVHGGVSGYVSRWFWESPESLPPLLCLLVSLVNKSLIPTYFFHFLSWFRC